MTKTFELPPKASNHCRHYSWTHDGPSCAVGVDLSAPGMCKRCLPRRDDPCAKREEYTEAEREAWKEATVAGTHRLFAAIAALPAPIPTGTSGKVPCPNCEGGDLRFSRSGRGAWLSCTTPNCCGAHLSIGAGDWPPPAEGEAE